MADLNKHDNRADWLTWAIEFMRRGLWADEEITVHGPHDSSGLMWGKAYAQIDGGANVECSFNATAGRGGKYGHNKYRPVRVLIWNEDDRDERFPLSKVSELTPKAQRWFRVARRTMKKLR